MNGKTLTITYTFDDGSTFTETKTPSKNFVSGATSRIKTTIAKSDLVKEPSYELRVLTFEDKDAIFEEYSFTGGDGNSYDIKKWSDLIPAKDEQYYMGSPLIYANSYNTGYTWWDFGNTELGHLFHYNYGIYNYAGGGMAISSHTVPFENLTVNNIYDYQVSVTTEGGHNGSENFCVAYNASEIDLEAAGMLACIVAQNPNNWPYANGGWTSCRMMFMLISTICLKSCLYGWWVMVCDAICTWWRHLPTR